VIEAVEFLPLNRRVARHTSRSAAVGALCSHLSAELTRMRVVMACGARAIFETELHGPDGAARLFLVALPTRHGQVCAGQGEARLLVTSEREMCGTKFCDTVALFAAIVIGGGGELALVNIFMAIAALRLSDSKDGVFALRDMAFVALHLGMPALEWIAGRGMLFKSKCRGLEAVHRMTNGAISGSGTRLKLTAVVVGMAIRANGMGHRRFEIALGVAFAAAYGRVLAEKGKSSLRVVETLKLRHPRPTRRAMAGLARTFETALVRIRVATGTRSERKPCVFDVRFGIRHRGVAFCASDSRVRSGELEFRRSVVESRSRPPCGRGVALCAVRTQLPSMLILMASDTRTAESQISVIQVLYLNSYTRGGQDLSSVMTLLTAQSSVAAG
jgi:hypothetical protein